MQKKLFYPFMQKHVEKTHPFYAKESFLSLHSVFNVHMSRVETNIV